MYLQLLEQKDKNTLLEQLPKSCEKINSSINYIADTLRLFQNFYKPNNSHESFKLHKALNSLLALNHKDITLYNIDTKILYSSDLELKTDRASLLNVMMIFLENSIHEFSISSVTHKKIEIEVEKKYDYFTIFFKDNAQNRVINSQTIFKSGSSNDKQNSGLGLKMVKELANVNLNASINAYTKNNWSIFMLKISLNKSDKKDKDIV